MHFLASGDVSAGIESDALPLSKSVTFSKSGDLLGILQFFSPQLQTVSFVVQNKGAVVISLPASRLRRLLPERSEGGMVLPILIKSLLSHLHPIVRTHHLTSEKKYQFDQVCCHELHYRVCDFVFS